MVVDVDDMEDLAIHPEPEPSSPFAGGEDEPESEKRVDTVRRRRGRPRGSKNRPKEVPKEPEREPEVKTIRRPRKPDFLPSLLAMGWGTVGLGAATFGHMLPEPLGKSVPAAGRMMQLQSKAGAGATLDKALRKTPIYRSIRPLINSLHPYAEIAGLLTGPIMVGAIALRPEILALPPVQGVAMMTLLPAVRQASDQADMELMSGIGEYTKEEVLRAQALLQYLISGKLEEESEVRVTPKTEENVTTEVPVG